MVRRLSLSLFLMSVMAAGAFATSGRGGALTNAAVELSTRMDANVHLRTMVMRPSLSDGALTITVAYSDKFVAIARESMGAEVIPLLLSVSALAPQGSYFDPDRIRVAQGGREWTPVVVGEERDLFSLDGQRAAGGLLAANEVRQVVLLLPEWFDVSQPMRFSYGASTKTLRLVHTESSIAARR
ncbi:MAG: hypothetical protein H5U38_10765 [Calditrichaeota bacterium]|nr:hypothetical protein [Calditrichota bacterium]